MTHEITFTTNPRNGLAVAQCSCGQYRSGTLKSVQAWAATHDLDEEDKPNGQVKDTE